MEVWLVWKDHVRVGQGGRRRNFLNEEVVGNGMSVDVRHFGGGSSREVDVDRSLVCHELRFDRGDLRRHDVRLMHGTQAGRR